MTLQEFYTAIGGDYEGVLGRGFHSLLVVRFHLFRQGRSFRREAVAERPADGSLDMLDGRAMEITDPTPFYNSIQSGEKKIAVGTDTMGAVRLQISIVILEEGSHPVKIIVFKGLAVPDNKGPVPPDNVGHSKRREENRRRH